MNYPKITIDGLTKQQVHLLDRIWSFKEEEGYELFQEWFHSLSYEEMCEVESLITLIQLEVMEMQLELSSWTDAQAYLDNIRKK